jgi:hypothetical protein
LAKSNAEEKQNLKVLLDQYNDKHSKQEHLQSEHATLNTEHQSVCVSKKQIVGLLHQKVKEKEEVCKSLEKQFQKEKSLDLDSFMTKFMDERKSYHKY